MKCLTMKSAGRRVLALGLALSLAFPGAAQSDIEQSQISISKGDTVKISDVDDWLIGVFTASDSINFSQVTWDRECVYSSSGAYQIEIVSGNGGGQLNLQSGSGDTMGYRIYSIWRAAGGGYFWTSWTTTTRTLTNMGGSSSLSCADEFITGTNLWFGALVTPADFNPAPPGIYQDFVTLNVAPE